MAKSKPKEEDPKRPTPVARDGAYVMMLVITLLAISVGCILMYLDNEEYGSKAPGSIKEADLKIKSLGGKAELTDSAGAAPAAPTPAAPGGAATPGTP
jgi:hypothetical protein